MHTYKSFAAICANQDVKIHYSIDDAAERNETTKPHCYAPTRLLVAIAEAGHMLRKEPATVLASAPIELARKYTKDVGMVTLTNMVNASLLPTAPHTEAPNFFCEAAQAIDTCCEAEAGFTRTLANNFGSRPIIADRGFQIIADGHEPIFLRKASKYGEPSAMTLTDINVNGIPYPAGSLARVDIRRDMIVGTSGQLECGYPEISPYRDEVISAEMVVKVGFMRLSSYALPPGNRAAFRPEVVKLEPKAREIAYDMTIGAIQDCLRTHMQTMIPDAYARLYS